MATYHQEHTHTILYHPTHYTVVIDPPNQTRALVTFATLELAKVYRRGLLANNPGVYPHSYILRPATASYTAMGR